MTTPLCDVRHCYTFDEHTHHGVTRDCICKGVIPTSSSFCLIIIEQLFEKIEKIFKHHAQHLWRMSGQEKAMSRDVIVHIMANNISCHISFTKRGTFRTKNTPYPLIPHPYHFCHRVVLVPHSPCPAGESFDVGLSLS